MRSRIDGRARHLAREIDIRLSCAAHARADRASVRAHAGRDVDVRERAGRGERIALFQIANLRGAFV
jgi:hypothetical protein